MSGKQHYYLERIESAGEWAIMLDGRPVRWLGATPDDAMPALLMQLNQDTGEVEEIA